MTLSPAAAALRAHLDERGEAPLCKCRCGEAVKWDLKKYRWQSYAPGHWPLIRGVPPLCACGCGQSVSRAPISESTTRWRKWRHGHAYGWTKHPDLPSPTRDGIVAYRKAYRLKFPKDQAARSRRYHEQHPEIRKWEHLRRYGLTKESYEALAAAQENRCAICGTDKPGTRRKLWCVDHDHVSGAIRGLLCQQCNAGLGCFADDPGLMQLAAKYLKEATCRNCAS